MERKDGGLGEEMHEYGGGGCKVQGLEGGHGRPGWKWLGMI